MVTKESIENKSKEELIALVLLQWEQIRSLNKRIEELERKQARSAAPFSKGQKKKNPQKPGRKAGKGKFGTRKAPTAEEITDLVEVNVPATQCEECGGELEEIGEELVSTAEAPEKPQVVIKGYRIKLKRCKICGKKYRGKHPEVSDDQHGATAHRLGLRLLGVAHSLHYEDGIPQRKVPGVLKKLMGADLTQGQLSQDAVKRGSEQGNVGKAGESIKQGIRRSERVHTDDTGWRTGGEGSHLMGFETPDALFYQIKERHRNEEVREVIPADYKGVMNTDRGKSYDAKELLGVKQQKCMSHIQRNLKDLEEKKKGKDKWFARELKRLFHLCVELWHRQREGTINGAAYKSEGKKLSEQITYHLRDRTLHDPDNQTMLNELGTHSDRGNLLRFLEDPLIEPTNNRAERALRGAVIARKVSQCSKNKRGADARAAFMSVIKTLRKRGHDIIDGLAYVMRTGNMPAYDAEHR